MLPPNDSGPTPGSPPVSATSGEVDRALAQAAEFALGALRQMQATPGSESIIAGTDWEGLAARLRIQFLFPQCSPLDQQWLTTLFWARQGLVRLVNQRFDVIPAQLKTSTEDAIRRMEQIFMTLLDKVRPALALYALTPVQQAILEREFFHIPFG